MIEIFPGMYFGFFPLGLLKFVPQHITKAKNVWLCCEARPCRLISLFR